jgi:RimJ/RimL family protein N-acetyltransferase
LGTELFRRVVRVAKEEKLARVVAEILPDNLPMKKISKRLGFRTSALDDPTSMRAALDL